MELKLLNPQKFPKDRKIVYLDESSLQNKSDIQEKEVLEWLPEFFDVYIIQADGLIHLLRGDYVISPIKYSPSFHGEWQSFILYED